MSPIIYEFVYSIVQISITIVRNTCGLFVFMPGNSSRINSNTFFTMRQVRFNTTVVVFAVSVFSDGLCVYWKTCYRKSNIVPSPINPVQKHISPNIKTCCAPQIPENFSNKLYWNWASVMRILHELIFRPPSPAD